MSIVVLLREASASSRMLLHFYQTAQLLVTEDSNLQFISLHNCKYKSIMHIVSPMNEFSIKLVDPSVIIIIFIYLRTRFIHHILLHVVFECFPISFTSLISLGDCSCFVPFLCTHSIYFIYSIVKIVTVIYKSNKIC
jgi:hypothetical protein